MVFQLFKKLVNGMFTITETVAVKCITENMLAGTEINLVKTVFMVFVFVISSLILFTINKFDVDIEQLKQDIKISKITKALIRQLMKLK